MKQMTIYDIAKLANVSVATVSRVINDTAPVKDSTRKKIEALIQQYQFQPNAMARSLLKKETGIIGIIVPDLTNPFYTEVLAGAETEAYSTGHTFLLMNAIGNYEKESAYLSMLRERRVDGMLFLGGRINLKNGDEELDQELIQHASSIPTVLINGTVKGNVLTRVATDEYKGACMAVQYLIDNGHKHIAFLGGEMHMSTTSSKLRAFKKTLKDAGLTVREEWILPDSFSIDSGRKQMEHLLSLKKQPTAVFCVNDFVAIGAIKTAIDHGVQVPEDMSIVGFDDIPLAHHFIPEITTVSQEANELGRTAIQVLQRMMNQEKVKKHTVIEPKLMVRKSSASLRAIAAPAKQQA
ncbi:LacI family DNA-binding transcriptional regulator [Paenibacillus camelliae]|uniref:LacI family DNA-binding transcriptional regulator n=1 Tax=Paenibacillus camelliae TaxID=512410 RepID=UPI00203C0FD7|nr:LacI family DNA-binding transcriptional regulator [Paenibacillus camelliae]MCM3634763.1 LacI family transcriptional regulator [Paenibacillus camelliae]